MFLQTFSYLSRQFRRGISLTIIPIASLGLCLGLAACQTGPALDGSALSMSNGVGQSLYQATAHQAAPLDQRVVTRAKVEPPAPIELVYDSREIIDPGYIDRTTGTQAASDLLTAVNQERTSRGLRSLERNAQLDRAAQDYAELLAQIGRIDHTGPDGSQPAERAERAGYIWGFIGENLAAGQNSPSQTVTDWLKSKGHRENMLDDKPVHAGVGFARGAEDTNHKDDGSLVIRGGSYWVLLVGNPRT